MARKRSTPQQIINKLRQAEAEIANGATVAQVCTKIAVTDQTWGLLARETAVCCVVGTMGKQATVIHLTDAERGVLEGRVRSGTTQQRHISRVRIILMACQGHTNVATAEEPGTRPATVGQWRQRFARPGLQGPADAPRSGRPAPYDDQTQRRIMNTHKPRDDRRLRRHPNVHLHFTPTHASWLNQIEIWFPILSRAAQQRASFTSPRQLRQAIDRFIEAHNQHAAPFEWNKRTVTPGALNSQYADLCR